jgi:acetolactate synthase I/II/III large subunit
MMAEAYGKLTGRPGICFAARGPGATNASPGVYIADQDATPMILFVGQPERRFTGRAAFQELDCRPTFSAMTKWVVQADDPARIPEIVARAFHEATSGRPGPVVVALPEDVLSTEAETADWPFVEPTESYPAEDQMHEMAAMLAHARLPVAILGGSRWSAVAVERFTGFAGACDLPVVVTFRRQMLFSADHPNYVGELGVGPNPALVDLVTKADVILLVGDQLSQVPSQDYTLLDGRTAPRLIHVHPDPGELGRLHHPHLAINASPEAFCACLCGLRPKWPDTWAAATRAARAAYLDWSDPGKTVSPGGLQLGAVMGFLRARLPADAVVCNGAGNYAAWVHRYLRFRGYGTQLAPTCGSMGYGVPAAVAARQRYPDRMVIAFAGDGCFLMNGQEFATAVKYDLPVIVIVIDNGMYGTIRMHQEREYPGRVSGTDLRNPDFAGYARAFGGHGERVERTDEFEPAFERAVAAGKPAIIHCVIEPDAIAPSLTISGIRRNALARGSARCGPLVG